MAGDITGIPDPTGPIAPAAFATCVARIGCTWKRAPHLRPHAGPVVLVSFRSRLVCMFVRPENVVVFTPRSSRCFQVRAVPDRPF